MARRAFRPGAAAISRRRETTWLDLIPTQATLPSAGSASLLFTLSTLELAMRPFTVVRTHLEIALFSDQAAAIEVQRAGVGIAVVSDQAVGIGITAIPTPITDMESNLWFLHQLIYADESALTDRTRPEKTMSIDSKAMRKVEIGDDLVVVVESVVTISSGSIFVVGGRILIKNH